jgi:hypothetical protein
MAASALSLSGDVKFTVDQCRVLRQVGVDTSSICPQPKKDKKR